MVSEEVDNQSVGGLLQLVNNGVVEGILVLVKPVGEVVVNNTSIMSNSKVSILVLGAGLLLQENRGLAKQVLLQFLLKGFIRRLGEQGLFLKDGKKTHGLLHELDSGLKIHAKVHHLPLNALPDILLLLKDKHVVVEELLELLVTEINTNLLKSVELENFKTSNIQDTDEVDLLHGGVNQGPVAEVYKPHEQPVVHRPGQGGDGVQTVVSILALVDPLSTDLDLGTDKVAIEQLPVLNTAELTGLLSGQRIIHLAGLLTSLLLEGHLTKMHDQGGGLESIMLLSLREAESVKGLVSKLQLLLVVNGVDLDLALGHEEVVIGVSGHPDHLLEPGDRALLNKLEEDVVSSLIGLLVSHTGLLKKIDINEASGQFSHLIEVDTDEFTES